MNLQAALLPELDEKSYNMAELQKKGEKEGGGGH